MKQLLCNQVNAFEALEATKGAAEAMLDVRVEPKVRARAAVVAVAVAVAVA